MGTAQILIRVVLDTNVIVSALILRGTTNQLVDFWKKKRFKIILSKTIFNEYLRVFTYLKFKLTAEEIKLMLHQDLLPFTEPVRVKEEPKIIRADPSDDKFLACAKEGKADFLVSGDPHLLNLKQYEKIPIVSVATFLSELAD